MEPDPYFQAIVSTYREAARPGYHQLSPAQGRAMLRAGVLSAPSAPDALSSVNTETLAINGPHGAIPVRVYTPMDDAGGAIVYMHSGGWVIGDLDTADATCRRLSAMARGTLVSVDYRLSPEHPFPKPLDDAYAALSWAAGRFPGALLVGGESAGANLAAVCAIRARDDRGPALCGQWLAYPVADHDFSTASYREFGDRGLLLTSADMRWFWDQYCPAGIDRRNPLISPLRLADAANLPAAMILVGGLDPLRDEGWALATHFMRHGVGIKVRSDTGMVHGYLGAAGAVTTAAEALRDSANWIRDRLDRQAGASSQ